MGSTSYNLERGIQKALSNIAHGDSILVELIREEDGKEIKGGYKTFKEFDQKAIDDYITESDKISPTPAIRANIYRLNLEKIN
jgi:hypothetical protein